MRQGEGVVRVLIADDSEIASELVEGLLEEDPRIRVIGRVQSGLELLNSPLLKLAQVLIVDILMPELGGLSVIRKLAPEQRLIAVSSVDADSKVASEALALGAIAFFNKRDVCGPEQAEKLREAVKSAAGCAPHSASGTRLVAVVGSTGAIRHIENLVAELRDLELAIVVVQHLPVGKDELLAQLLGARGVKARVARDGDPLEPGLFVAPAGKHLEIDARERVRLASGDPINGHLPSADVLLRSIIRLGRRATAVMLSGLGDDGARAMAELANSGGRCFALDPRDCQAAFMPRAALAASTGIRAVRAADLGAVLRQAVHGA